jgi:membrane peptidoglycan carboxypeptidase
VISFANVIAHLQGDSSRAVRGPGARLSKLISRGFVLLALALAGTVGFFESELAAGRQDMHHRELLKPRNGRRLRASLYGHKPGRHSPEERYRKPPPLWMLPAALKVFAVVGLAAVTFLTGSNAYISVASQLPDAQALASEPLAEDTLIYSADGVQLADLHPPGYQHYYEPLSSMGQNLPNATIAIEDLNFYHEPGIDPQGIARAAWVDWREHKTVQGASTITQQLVKLRLLDNSPTFERKAKEALLAIQVDRTFSKDQILEMYLNTVFYGHDSYGSAAAAQNYFHIPSAKLDLAQASMLAGIPQNPTYNNPFANWPGAKDRQRQVLDAMVRAHFVSQEDADKAFQEDLSPPAHMFLPANVIQAPAFVSYVIDQLRKQFGDKGTYTGGYRVVGTLNWGLEQIAQAAVTNQVNAQRWRNLTQGALVAIDPHTGAIVAMVGSADPNQHGGQYNMAVQPRNPGSSMKIYTYTAAIASGKYTMVTPIPDTPIKIPDGTKAWEPKNYDGKWHGTCQLQQCMGNSLNVPAVKVELGVGVANVVSMARLMGAPPYYTDLRQNTPPEWFGPSLTLGGYGETVLQMATGASVLGAQGVLHPPYAIQQITASDGSSVFKANPGPAGKQVLDPKVAFIMEQIMSNDNNRAMIFGRGTPLTLPGRTVGAKTGTTDNFTDGWTLGYTPDLAAAVWMGNTDFSPMVKGSDGVFVAAPAWHNFMQGALDAMGKGNVWYAEPPGLGHAGGNWFLPGTSPSTPAPQLPAGIVTSSGSTSGSGGSSGGATGGGTTGGGGNGGHGRKP